MKRTFILFATTLASMFVMACSSTVTAEKPCTSPAATNCSPYFGGNSDAASIGSKGGNAGSGTGSSAGSSAGSSGNSGKGGLGAGNGKGGNAGGKGR